MIKGSHHCVASKRQIALRNSKNIELPLFEGNFEEEKKKLQKESRARSKKKYYLKQKKKLQKLREENNRKFAEDQKEKYWKEWSEIQTKISRNLDEQIKKFNKENKDNPDAYRL
jgi:hypothetical protein